MTDEARTSTDTVFLNADGSKTLERSMQATNFRENGHWQRVDASLVPDTIAGGWRSNKNSWIAQFSSTSDNGIGVSVGTKTFRFKPIGGLATAPQVTGKTPNQVVTYPDVWPGVNLLYEVSGSELKESIVIKKPGVASTFKFDVSGTHLTADAKHPGSFKLDGAFSAIQLVAPTIATANRGIVGGAPIVSQSLNGSTLTVSLDPKWAKKQSAKAFPLVIDPSYQVGTANNYVNYKSDGYVCSAGQGCGNSTGNVSNNYWRFMYNVNLSPMQGKYVVAASLHMEMPNPDGVHYWGTTDSRWIYATHAGCFGFNCVDGSYGQASGLATSSIDMDVTGLYRAAVSGNDLGSWMMVRGEEVTNWPSYKLFSYDRTIVSFTYDALPTPSTIVTPGSPSDGGVAVSTQPNLKSTVASDTDGPGPLKYRYVVGTGKSGSGGGNTTTPGVAVTGWVADSGDGDLPQWTVPDNVLSDGTTYYWQILTWDSFGGAAGSLSPVYSFKVDLREGKDATQAFDSVGPVNVDLATGNLTTSAATHNVAALGGNLGISLDYNSPQRSRQGLVAQYWNNTTFGGTPALTRVEPNIDYNWNTGSPYSGMVAADNFSSSWSGYLVAPYTGTYTFGCRADDSLLVQVGSQIAAGGSCYNTVTWGSSSINLTAGQIVPFLAVHSEATGPAYAQVYARVMNGGSTVFADNLVPTDWFQTGVRPIATPHGLVGRYYPGSTLPSSSTDTTNSFLTRTDTSLGMDWGTGSPVPGGPTDNFVARWTGYFKAPQTGTYTFGARGDDGVRLIVGSNNTTVVDSWNTPTTTPVWAAAGTVYNAGDTVPITLEYKEGTGAASVGLYVDGPGIDKLLPIPSDWLLPKAQVLPDGWALGVDADGNLSYDYATIGQNSVIFRDSTGETHEYKWNGSGYTPPVNEAGQLVRNADGSLTLQDADGQTYVFNSGGNLISSTTPQDDRHPAALTYTYSGSPARLTQVTDPVDSSRWAKVSYFPDSTCPAAPPGLTGTPSGMICALTTSDARVTQFAYSNVGTLSRLIFPGAETTDYGYDTLGRIASLRDSLANDAITSGQRVQDGTVLTEVAYDSIGRVSTVTMPAATTGAPRQAHSYGYQPSRGAAAASTLTHITGATEPAGFSQKVTYDSSYRTTDSADLAGLITHTDWDVDGNGAPRKDLVLSTRDPVGFTATTLYDYADRPTDQYGPAPYNWFGADRKPSTSPTDYTTQIPHTQTGYDESINGLAATYYDVSSATNGTGVATKLLVGAPRSHGTGVGPASGDVVRTWGTSQPITPSQSTYGWGVRLTGDIHLGTTGTYGFRVQSDDGVRLWIDDTLVIDDWSDGGTRSHAMVTGFSNASDSWHRVRLDYYNKAVGTTLDTDASLALYMTPPGGAETNSLGSLLKPHYGLTTSQKTFDSSAKVGDVSSTTTYGANPELGLAQSSTLDAAGLNYTSSNAYEAQGASGYLRQTSKTLPGGTSTSYSYYGGTETRQNPCNTAQSFKQAGMLKLKTEADPDGTGPITGRITETVYSDAGRVVASRYNTDAWTCTTYDSRGRVTQVTVPSFGSAPARTITNTWAVGNNPFVTSSSDASGTIKTTIDLLGRVTSYTDANNQTTTTAYDALGRLSSRAGPLGAEVFTYDNYNRLTAQKLDGTTIAAPSYDTYGRLIRVAYQSAGSMELAIVRDALGRTVGTSYSFPDDSTLSDAVTRSQSGQIVSGTELYTNKSYTYDKAGRLISASIGGTTFSYGFGTPSSCTGTYNTNAGKNANRTSQTIGSATTTYCYDNADRLVSSTDPALNAPIYDSHGNTTQLGTAPVTAFAYDASDRNTKITEGAKSVTYTRDVQGRVIGRTLVSGTTTTNKYGFTGSGDSPDLLLDGAGTVVQKYLQLPGGVLMTLQPALTGNAARTYSLPDVHGDIMVTADAAGNGIGTFLSDPFGNPLNGGLYSGTPTNTATGSTYSWVGQHEKDTETAFTLAPTEMGARVYLAKLGRFLQVDPVEGGTPNSYVYPTNPVSVGDPNGTSSLASGILVNAGDNANNMGTGLTVAMVGLGIGACLVGALVCAGAVGLGALIEAAKSYASDGSALKAGGMALLSILFDRGGGIAGKKAAEWSVRFIAPTIARQIVKSGLSTRNASRKIVTVKKVIAALSGGAASFGLGRAVPDSPSVGSFSPSVFASMDRIISGHYGLF